MRIEVDIEQFTRDIKAGKSIGRTGGTLGSLIKQLTKAALASVSACIQLGHPAHLYIAINLKDFLVHSLS